MASAIGELVQAAGQLPRHWWVIGLRGMAAIIFGVLAFIWPGITLAALILFFGAYAAVDGVLTLYTAIRWRGQSGRALILEGVIGLGTGLVTLLWPAITGLGLLFVIAGWAIATGVMEVLVAIRLRKLISGEWALILSGVSSIVFGVVLVVQPGAGALGLIWLLGTYAIGFGTAMLALSWQLHGLLDRTRGLTPSSPIRPV
jgi:uncharacterized membrane protein HdeD (DUF308 family)